MSNLLEGNGLLESSRMMLPEHKESIIRHRVGINRKTRPTLDEQRIEELVRTISVSIFTDKEVRIKLFEEYNDKEIVGKIEKITTESRQLKIGFKDTFEWIRLEDILEMELVL